MISYVSLCAVNRSTLWVFFQDASKNSIIEANPTNPKKPQDPEGAMSVCMCQIS